MSASAAYPLIAHPAPESIVAWRHGAPLTARHFLADVDALAAAMPAGRHVLNTCGDRYRFAVGLAAALVSERVSLLPSMLTAETIANLRNFAPDLFCLTDGERPSFDVPVFDYPAFADGVDAAGGPGAMLEIPSIPADRPVAWLFTSGSTGKPLPHRKTWGPLVKNVRAEAHLLGLGDGRAHTIVATVPAQHMYGFESTVLVALQSGTAFAAGRPLYPADICATIASSPAPRLLVTTPFHLRTLLDSGVQIPPVAMILSATAPLSVPLAREAEERCAAPLLEIYGSTETGQIACRRPTAGAEWRLFPDVLLTLREGRTWASGGHVEQEVAMGDVLEITGARRFVLHGRSADMINIAGKRSSIAYLNHQLLAVPGVRDGVFFVPENEAPDGVTRLHALVVADGQDAAQLRLALRAKIEPAFMPRRILFVDSIPRNATGKLMAASLRATVTGHPAIAGEAATDTIADEAEAIVTIGVDHPALAGHFPGRPIVPGVVLLDAVLVAIGNAQRAPMGRCRLGAVKFLHPVVPPARLTIHHRRAAGGVIDFSIDDGTRSVASGRIDPVDAIAAATTPSEVAR